MAQHACQRTGAHPIGPLESSGRCLVRSCYRRNGPEAAPHAHLGSATPVIAPEPGSSVITFRRAKYVLDGSISTS